MKYDTVLAFWGTPKALAEAFEVSVQAVSLWKEKGMVPRGVAYEAQVITKGKLKVDRALYARNTRKYANSRAAVPGRPGRLA